MGQFRLGISTMKTILALFGFFLTARALSGRQLKNCIDGCPVANRYRNCVSNCLSSQGGGGGIITQQGGVQNCQGQRCVQNNPGPGQNGGQNNQIPSGGIFNQQGGVQNCRGQRCNQNNPGSGSFGSSTQNCQGSRCNQNNGRNPNGGRPTQNCVGSQCYRNDGGKSGGGNINFGDCFPFCNK